MSCPQSGLGSCSGTGRAGKFTFFFFLWWLCFTNSLINISHLLFDFFEFIGWLNLELFCQTLVLFLFNRKRTVDSQRTSCFTLALLPSLPSCSTCLFGRPTVPPPLPAYSNPTEHLPRTSCSLIPWLFQRVMIWNYLSLALPQAPFLHKTTELSL